MEPEPKGIVRATARLARKVLGRRRRDQARLLFEVDADYRRLYDAASVATATPPTPKRFERFYNLAQLFDQTLAIDGDMAECGCWLGLSSHLLNHWIRRIRPDHDGSGWHCIDSFEGLSDPTGHDSLTEGTRGALERRFGTVKGAFAGRLEAVQAALKEFPRIAWHKGWIPAVLATLPDRRYRFVHVDVDLHEPTLGAIEYFFPRLAPGGLIVCDDYGSLAWPGARKAIDEFAVGRGLRPLRLSTGQAVLFARHG